MSSNFGLAEEQEVSPAPLRFRLLAMIYDALVVIGIWVFTIVVAVTLRGDVVTGAWVQSLMFVETFAFFAFFWIQRGQTLGMLAWRLRIESTHPFSLRQALFRFIGAILGFAAVGLGYFWIWIDRRNRSWSDILSDSIVVRYPKSNQ